MTAMSTPTPSERQREIDAAIEALAAPRQPYTAQPRTERPKGFFSTALGAVVIVVAVFGTFAIMLWSAPLGIILLIALGICGAVVARRYIAADDAAHGHVPAPRRSVYGEVNPQLTCPHCSVTGHVHVRQVKTKQGISGGKATGAILTGGASLWLTGLSRKGYVTSLHCDNCTMTWSI